MKSGGLTGTPAKKKVRVPTQNRVQEVSSEEDESDTEGSAGTDDTSETDTETEDED